jgi:tripartite ATP-independent transporter DctM subunit
MKFSASDSISLVQWLHKIELFYNCRDRGKARSQVAHAVFEWYEAGLILIGLLFFFMALGIPVAISFMATNMIAMLIFVGTSGFTQIVDNSTDLISNFVLTPVPMFILMGSIFFQTGLAARLFDGLYKLFGRIPGRLSYLSVAGGTMFSMLTGSSMANTAMLGSTLVPEMQRRGYTLKMSMGPILGIGGLAMIVPPSNLAVMLASMAGLEVAKLLIAGVLPGLILVILYCLTIFIQLRLDTASAPGYDVHIYSLKEKMLALFASILPMAGVILFVTAVIVFGIATPTEAGAFGVLGVLALALAFRQLNWGSFTNAIWGTVKVSGMLFFILMNSTIFSQVLALSGTSTGVLKWALSFNLPPLIVMAVMFAMLLILGTLMDSLSILMVTVPLFFPLARSLGFDAIWFGVIVLLSLEIGIITPPFGMSLFIMQGFGPKGTTLMQVARASVPYLICELLVVALLTAFPIIVTILPNLM